MTLRNRRGMATPEVEAAAPLLTIRDLAIEVRGASQGQRLVEDVDLDLLPGRTLGVVGESGSGKTVTAMSILDLLPPALIRSSGKIVFAGRDLSQLKAAEMRAVRGNEIGVIFQDPHNSLDPAFTIEKQMTETIRRHTERSSKEATELAVSLLDRVGIPQPQRRIRDYPHQLSGGMAQRVMIALAISCEPRLLIADEPTTALDVTVQAQILSLLRSLQEETGMSLMLISHDLSIVAEMADDMAVMYAGHIVERGRVLPTFAKPLHPYTEALLTARPASSKKGEPLTTIPGVVPSAESMPPGCRFHPRCRYSTAECSTVVPAYEMLSLAPVRGVRCLRHAELELSGIADQRRVAPTAGGGTGPDPKAGRVLLEVRSLRREYGLRGGRFGFGKSKLVAVHDVNFDLHEGETLGLVGESGAGKSTVGRMVLGLERPTAGSVVFDSVDLATVRGARRRTLRRDFQAVFQNPYASLDPTMTIGDSVAEPLQVHARLGKAEEKARVIELLDQVGLGRTYVNRYPHALSGGQRQRVAIARALALNPKLVVCDEPVSALDVSTQAQVINLFRDLQQGLDLTYLFIGHDLSVVYQISDRMAVMYLGDIVEIGPSDAVYLNPRHPYTKMLLGAVLSIDPTEPRLGRSLPARVSDRVSTGCPFAARCPDAMERCWTQVPGPNRPADGVQVWCHLFDSDLRLTDDASQSVTDTPIMVSE